MKKLIAAAVAVVFSVVLFAACGQTTKNNANSNLLDKIKKSGEITIGTEEGYPPMEFRDGSGKLVGFDVDFSNEVAKRLGVKANFLVMDFNGLILALNSNKFDVAVASISITDERKKNTDFSASYINGGQVIAVKSGREDIKGAGDLKGKVIACELGTTGEKVANGIKGVKELKKYDKITEAFQDMSIGRVDAAVIDEQVGGYYIQKKKGEFKIVPGALSKEPMGVAYRKGDDSLKKEIDKIIADMKKDGTLSKLSVKWFGFDVYKE
ncbi:ABC transporter substrate-binding protein [Clostridium luticellarii]|jgi:polar amino acid transport system substrate-binding protein|uniref:ABC transporter substrate-binding protein n=1 Tax=Clostridium luticellarii TaxID=1691940 RepID=UPI00235791CE|nr:ABC transporter substrate-binding protein [Clostridium luticellarii]MCI1944344.1 ABC transporter substrate-binding protein [Clostridium luticellarii]MCI1967464.1 ABC transporter substrate-binding protein [Clostridium luticellarii]MCI1994976.1 ABC transporter substrate-binding protein [Clostridium luticellarii]MCI2041015.1 ABC transporter substrate-binding protein [Clostridium luticellarii]